MDFLHVVEQRRAVRQYRAAPIDRPLIEWLISTATLAPSAMNLQPWRFAVISGVTRGAEYARRAREYLIVASAAAPQFTAIDWPEPHGRRAPETEDAARGGLPAGTRYGLNDWKRANYGGPAPPIGRHRYFHKLYALDSVLPALEHPTKARLLNAMRGHVLAEAQLVGTYQRGG